MTFHQSYSGYTFDPVFSGSFDERFHSFRFSQDHHRGFYSYPPNLGSIPSQNVDLNCYPIPTSNVPYPSFSGESFHQLPYVNHAVVPSRFPVDPWANLCSSDTYFATPPDNCSRFLNRSLHDCCNVQQNFTQPNHVHSGFLRLDDDNPVGQYQQASDIGFLSSGYTVSKPSQMQYFQCHASPFQQKETVNTRTNDCFAMPRNYSIDEIMRTVVVTSPNQRGEDGTAFGIQSSLLDENNMQWPSFSRYSPLQLCASGLNFEANTGVDTLSAVTDYNTEGICGNKSESVSHQSLVEIPSFPSTGRMLADFAVNDSGRSGYQYCRSSSSCVIAPSVTDTQTGHINTVPITAHGFTCRAVPEFPHSEEGPVALAPAIDTSDKLSTWAESTCGSETLSQCSTLTEQTFMAESGAVIDSSGGCAIPMKEDERIAVSTFETSMPLSGAITVSTPAATSATMEFRNCQLQTDGSEKTKIISAAHSTVILSELSVTGGSREPMPEVMDSAESCAVTCESVDTVSNSSDDVIVLSPLPVTTEHSSPVFANPKSDVVTSDCCRMQPSSQPGCANANQRLHLVLRSSLPNSLPVSSHTVPSTDHDFSNSRGHGVLQSRAKHIIDHNCGVHTTSCQLHLPVSQHAISCIPTNSQQLYADVTTGSSIHPMFCHPPITIVCDATHNIPLCQQSAQTELQRQLYMTPLSPQQNLSIPRTYSLTVESNNRRNVFENSQHKRIQKSLLRLPASCQAVPQRGIAWCNARGCTMSRASASQNVRSVSSSALPIVSPVVRSNPNQNQCTNNHRYYSLPVYRRDSCTLQLRGMALRKNGTYSIRAASIMLQRLKQAKLSDLPSARAARQHLLNRRLSSLSYNGAMIDLTADDDGDEDAVETCERIFARARRRKVRMPSLWRPRQCFVRRSNLADASRCGSKYRSVKKTFAVDRSLPFYRCFVQQLLRNYRFTSSGVPVKVYGLFLPLAPPAVSFARRGAPSPAHSCTKELARKQQPVVLLERLDPSVVKQYGVLAADCSSEEEECVRDAVNVSDSAAQKLQSEDSSNKDSVPVSQNCASTNHGQEMVEFDRTARENIREENFAVNPMANGRECDELISLCRPVSVTLERLDGHKIHQICKELCENEDSKDIQSLKRPGTESSASELSWTVTQIPRANKVPILVIRSLSLTQSASWKKVAEKTDACTTRQLRSALKCLTTGSSTGAPSTAGGIQHPGNEAPVSSKFNTSSKRISKKLSGRRKLRFRSSALVSLRSRNYDGHFLRRRISATVIRPRCQNSLKRNQKQSKSSKLLSKKAENLKKTYAKLTEHSYEPESSVTTAELNDHLISSDLTPKNGLLTDSLPCDFVVNRNSPEDCESSDSNTVELSPRSTADVNSSVDHRLHCDAVLNHALSTDFWPYNSVFNEECESSDSNTVVVSPCSATDDLTIAYRSPLSDVFDFGELSADEQERLEGSVEAADIDVKSSGTCIAFDVDKELKPTSYVDCEGVISQLYSTTVSRLTQSPGDTVESSAFPKSFSCGLVMSSAVNSEQLQPTPVRFINYVNDGLQRLCTINNSSSEFADKDRRKCEMAASVPVDIAVENTSTCP